MAKIENNYDFTKEKINVMYKGELHNLSFLEIETLLDQNSKIRSNIPFMVLAKGRLITQSRSLLLFAQNISYHMKQKMYFDKNTVFKMNIECGSVHLFNLN